MKPIEKGKNYLCPKCKSKVGYCTITGKEMLILEYRKEPYCSNCGEKIEWKYPHKTKEFEVHLCGHMCINDELVINFLEKKGFDPK